MELFFHQVLEQGIEFPRFQGVDALHHQTPDLTGAQKLGQSAQNGGVDEAHKGAFQLGQLLPMLLHGDGEGRAQEGAGLSIYVVLHDLRQTFRQLPVDELTQGVGVHVLQASVGQEGEDGVGPVGELPGEGLAQPRLCGLLHQESAKKGGQVLPLLDILIRSKGLDEQLPGGLVRCGCRFKELIQPIGDGCFGFGGVQGIRDDLGREQLLLDELPQALRDAPLLLGDEPGGEGQPPFPDIFGREGAKKHLHGQGVGAEADEGAHEDGKKQGSHGSILRRGRRAYASASPCGGGR